MKYSVIIPIYEQWHFVADLINRLIRQSIGMNNFEVLLIDNGSKKFLPIKDLPDFFRILNCNTPGAYAARNLGIKNAKGEWLVFTDADCLPAYNWLQCYEECSGRNKLLAGNVITNPVSSDPSIYEIYDIVKGIPQKAYVKEGYAATANLMFSKELARMVGNFEELYFSGSDIEFCKRAVTKGMSIHYVEKSIVYHRARTNLRELATKVRRIKGASLRRSKQKHLLLSLARTMIPPVRVMALLARKNEFSIRYRVFAIIVQVQLWGFEIFEMFSFLIGNKPVRH
ncbi:glycosyltransferase [uncultured Microbulbifer sp.]|uniref:glycosyltransferase family 2 protein n=1 Tax=uncultured Microbulbifer sp. TaxID=348147 RepID=UPI002606E128|nr:glycosyltransferase [uncultured Microbulbifer sp.]